MNRVALQGTLAELGALRYTPAGIPAIDLRIQHASEQPEAGGLRQVNVELSAVAFGTLATQLSASRLGCTLSVIGFLAAKSQRSTKIVLHLTNIEFVEGV